MELQEKIADLFKAKDVQQAPCNNNSEIELKKIEQQLNQHLKSKQGLKFKRVTIGHDKFYDETKFSEVIDEELKNKTFNKKWKSLPMFMKWQLLQVFFKDNNIIDTQYIATIRTQLMKNILQVEYENSRVIKII